MVASRPRRVVETVPALLVGLLEQAGKLPRLPDSVVALEQFGKRRDPVLAEVAALKWVVIWDGPSVTNSGLGKVSGVAAYRDVFDYPSGSDVRELIHVAGSRRSVIDLIRWLRDGAIEAGRRLIGSVDERNRCMLNVLRAMGFAHTRVIWEDPRS